MHDEIRTIGNQISLKFWFYRFKELLNSSKWWGYLILKTGDHIQIDKHYFFTFKKANVSSSMFNKAYGIVWADHTNKENICRRHNTGRNWKLVILFFNRKKQPFAWKYTRFYNFYMFSTGLGKYCRTNALGVF